MREELAEEKTLITHARSGATRFLGSEITVRQVIHRAELLNESDYTIICTSQLACQGIANSSQLAYTMHTLH